MFRKKKVKEQKILIHIKFTEHTNANSGCIVNSVFITRVVIGQMTFIHLVIVHGHAL